MRAIFLCKQEKEVQRVYAGDTIARFRALVTLDDKIYSKEDVLAAPATFADVEIILSTWGMPTFTEEEIAACFPHLKCVCYAAGTVQSFARPFLSRGVKVFSAWAANAVPVAEYTVAQILLAGKGFFAQTRLMQAQRLDEAKARKEKTCGSYGARVGLIGCGMIGSMVAEKLKAYRLDVVAYDPFLSRERADALGVKRVGLEELFSTAQVVSNHLANNEQTKGMLNGKLFEKLVPFATFLNTGRGAQVVEDDLVQVLQARPDLTAVLDVTYPEPPEADHPFYTLPNCFLTPHIAGSLGDEVVRMAEYMAEELSAYCAGAPTRYEVSEKMLETMA
jgi:phosphoglycerate dehydrogenase-like enzyme